MKRKSLALFLCLSIFLVVGCASQKFSKWLATQMNVLTYDQAIMNWGRPASTTEGDQIFVAVWGSESTGAVAAPIGRSIMVLPVESGWKLTIGFNKITKRMVSYRYQSW